MCEGIKGTFTFLFLFETALHKSVEIFLVEIILQKLEDS